MAKNLAQEKIGNTISQGQVTKQCNHPCPKPDFNSRIVYDKKFSHRLNDELNGYTPDDITSIDPLTGKFITQDYYDWLYKDGKEFITSERVSGYLPSAKVSPTETIELPPQKFQIDFAQLSSWEGGSFTKGYVPWKPTHKKNNSGVTVGSGVDLGSIGTKLDNVSPELREKLNKYDGLTKQKACNELANNPLTITEEEAKELDGAVKKEFAQSVQNDWDNRINANQKFEELTKQQQTVILSRAYQQGPNGWKTSATSRDFFNYAQKGEWDSAITALEKSAKKLQKSPRTAWQGNRFMQEVEYLKK